jgi:hypothetical protein
MRAHKRSKTVHFYMLRKIILVNVDDNSINLWTDRSARYTAQIIWNINRIDHGEITPYITKAKITAKTLFCSWGHCDRIL